jgi:hypothetical protein
LSGLERVKEGSRVERREEMAWQRSVEVSWVIEVGPVYPTDEALSRAAPKKHLIGFFFFFF